MTATANSTGQQHSTSTNSSEENAWKRRVYVVVTLLACCLSLAQNTPPDPDLWGHVQYGEDAFALGGLHQTATHTFTAVGHPWINHEILSEFVLAIVANTVGAHGFIVGKSLLGLLVIGLMMRASMRRNNPIAATCICAVLTALTLTAFWPVRPQLASYVGLALVVVVLDWSFAKWPETRKANWRPLLFLPLIFFVWTNSHGGFVAGLCLTTAYLGVRATEIAWSHWRTHGREIRLPEQQETSGVMGILALVAATLGCWLFSLFNPYGIELHRWMFESLGSPRPEISEWAPPRWSDPHFMPFAMLSVATWGSLLMTKRRRDPAQLLLLALCFWQATSHSRHIALFAILAGFWIPMHCGSVLAGLEGSSNDSAEPGNQKEQSRSKTQPVHLVYGATALVIVALLSWRVVQRWSDFPVERAEYPVAALQYIADEQLEGNLIVSFDWAQYALAALEPNIRVQFDGRFRTCYPQDVIDMHFDFLLGDVPNRHRAADSGPIDPTRILHHGDPNLVLVDRRFGHSVDVMESQQTDFCLLYQDGLAQVWGKRQLYDDPTNAYFVSPERRPRSDELQAGSVLWPAFPQRDQTEVAAK